MKLSFENSRTKNKNSTFSFIVKIKIQGIPYGLKETRNSTNRNIIQRADCYTIDLHFPPYF